MFLVSTMPAKAVQLSILLMIRLDGEMVSSRRRPCPISQPPPRFFAPPRSPCGVSRLLLEPHIAGTVPMFCAACASAAAYVTCTPCKVIVALSRFLKLQDSSSSPPAYRTNVLWRLCVISACPAARRTTTRAHPAGPRGVFRLLKTTALCVGASVGSNNQSTQGPRGTRAEPKLAAQPLAKHQHQHRQPQQRQGDGRQRCDEVGAASSSSSRVRAREREREMN